MVEIKRLDNGVRVVLEPIPYLRSVAVGIWVLAGSRDEPPEWAGISHFCEHMFFKGTSKRSAGDIANEMDRVGGHINAYTAKEITCYGARVLDDHFGTAMDVLADMFFNSAFCEDEIEKEKNVVLEEISMYEDRPEEVALDILESDVWSGNALGRPVLGNQETVGSFKRADFMSFMRKAYRPERIVVSVAGKYDEAAVMEMVNRYFSSFDNDAESVAAASPAVYRPAVVTRDKDVEQLHLCLAFPGIPLGSDASYALTALNTIFGSGISSRLFQNIREKHGLAYSIYSYPASYRDAGVYIIYAALNPGSAKTAAELIKAEISGLFSNRITEENLRNTKEQLKSNFMLSLESTSNRMSSNARSELLLNRVLTPDELMAKVEAITLEGVYELAESIFDMKKMSVSSVGRLAQSDLSDLINAGGAK
ncbi:MAG: insulinase family protein [Defluviitaleaceae bacterium]|nr:insulinase family protein [Defluviitaleaceae bacterium]MCL2836866.1 insulinase family protein [Defluviitaleaceae bacterium]